jgi:hypothetical protein
MKVGDSITQKVSEGIKRSVKAKLYLTAVKTAYDGLAALQPIRPAV